MINKREITGIGLACLIAIAVLLSLAINASAEVTFTSLEPISHGLKLPEDVAIAPDGKVYAVDGSQGLVMVYNSTGVPAGNIWVAKPTSIAVGSNGQIYIGSNEDLSVKIRDSSYKIIGSLGSGVGEFNLPRNIAIDKTTGNVYVVDQIDQSIKIYNSSGTYLSKINDYPNLPQDVTIMNSKIYVIDHPLITDQWGGIIRGAQVRVFDMDGNVLEAEAFGSYGDQEGQFVRPAGITSDTNGVLYISDSFHGVVMCFEGNGTYLGAIQNQANPMVTPMGIALGEDRRLLVVSLNTASVHVFGLEGYTPPEGFDVSPSSLTFTAEEGQANPPEQNLTISNEGSETKTYTASSSEEWIVLDTPSSTIDPGSAGVIPVGVNASGLSVGIFNGNVAVSDGAVSKDIPVTLEITQPVVNPTLSVTPGELTFVYKIGDTQPAPQKVTIELANDNGTPTWTAKADRSRISIVPSDGQGTTSFTNVSVDPTGLEKGNYTGTITIEAPNVNGSPATISVALTVLYGGAIQVTCNIEEASFSIEGSDGTKYEGSGENWTADEIPDGTYTITYNQVTGYKTPLSETKELTNAETISFEGNYVSLAMAANILVSRGDDYQGNKSAVGIFDAEGVMLSSFSPFAEDENDGSNEGNIFSSFWYRQMGGMVGVNTAIGDINGDGNDDIIVGRGPCYPNDAEIAAYNKDGTLIEGSKFVALSTKNGVNIAVADFDRDGKVEVVVGSGPYFINPAQVKIFTFDSGAFLDTGINFNPFNAVNSAFNTTGGVYVAAGDIDGDNVPELITTAGRGFIARRPEVRVWKVDTSGSSWAIVETDIHFIAFDGIYEVNVATGDLNGDGKDEIIVASGPDSYINKIKVFNGDGTDFGLEIIDSSSGGGGLKVASGDLDKDGKAEIVVGLGPFYTNPSTVKIYKEDGTLLNIFNGFADSYYGAPVSVGNLELSNGE